MPRIVGLLKWGLVGTVGIAGGLWVINLPVPPLRQAIAKTAPILLTPSYFNMDRNYRAAIANVEQSDQLINQATSSADLELGAEKVQQAQENLDQLPVWFLGYQPVMYCQWFSCGWRFTLDEFQQARQRVGRMDAQVFQERNAFTQLQQAEASLTQAKAQHQQATDDPQRQAAIAAWQGAIDQLTQLPPTTLAGRTAQTQLTAAQRDFQAVTGIQTSTQQTNTLISAAKAFGLQAAEASQNPPHTAVEWEAVEQLWRSAIAQLQRIPPDAAGYSEAQTLNAQYQRNLGEITTRKQAEQAAVTALSQANSKIAALLASTPQDAAQVDRPRTAAQIQSIITDLETIQPGTTAHPQAQELLTFAKAKLNELQ